MKKIFTITIAIFLILTFNYHTANMEEFFIIENTPTIINNFSLSDINDARIVASGTDSRSNMIGKIYSPSPGNGVKDNKHMTSYKNTGTVLVY